MHSKWPSERRQCRDQEGGCYCVAVKLYSFSDFTQVLLYIINSDGIAYR